MKRERCGHKEMWVIGDSRAIDNQLIGAGGDDDDDVWTKMGCSTTTAYYYSLIFSPSVQFSDIVVFQRSSLSSQRIHC